MVSNFYILTGGPGSGKSTVIDALAKKGFVCVPEVARQIIKEQNLINGDATHWKNKKKFMNLMLEHSIDAYRGVMKITREVVFFDRGIPELIGYCEATGIEIPQSLINAVQEYSYNPKVFIMPPWREIYKNDSERKQDFQEAIKTFNSISKSYEQCGYCLIEVPKLAVEQRAEFILQNILGV
ncbi:MAG: AAA family ATPase [Holosporales bacterium]